MWRECEGNLICNLGFLQWDQVQKNNKTARDTLEFLGIASSFAIKVKVREMDQSIRSVAESLCLVYTLTKKRAILY